MLKKLLVGVLFFSLLACQSDGEKEDRIAQIPVTMKVTRFDQIFARATPDSLPRLKTEFSYLFPSQYPDSMWVDKMTDTLQFTLEQAVEEEFADLSGIKEDLERLYQHIRYYFPARELPEVVTLTSEVDYRTPVIWTDQWLLIGLDTYLGAEHPLYRGIQDYIRKNMSKDQILPDVAGAFAESLLATPSSRSFLAGVIHQGKILYIKDLLIPFAGDSTKIGYTADELNWAKRNEDQIWRYFVENELLFSSDSELGPRFLFPAPFSKFYLKLDHESPPRLGSYIGWMIVRNYMKEEEVSVEELLKVPASELFNKSNYKPKKNG